VMQIKTKKKQAKSGQSSRAKKQAHKAVSERGRA
jgi:hypothetical protein